MRPTPLNGSVLAGALIWTCMQSTFAAEELIVVSPEDIRKDVKVEINTMNDSTISGVVTNNTDHRIKDAEILVRYDWIWRNEYRPGEDNPGWAASYVIDEEIGPNESVSFTFEPDQPTAARDDGHFQQSVAVTGYTQFE